MSSPSDSEFLGDGTTSTSATGSASEPRAQSFTDVAERRTGTAPSSTSGNQLVEQPINVRSSEQAGKPRRVTVRARIIVENPEQAAVEQPSPAGVAPSAEQQPVADGAPPVEQPASAAPEAAMPAESAPPVIAAQPAKAEDPPAPIDPPRAADDSESKG